MTAVPRRVTPRIPQGLVPLRVPHGWTVVFNIFVDLPPYEELTPEDADAYLSEDLLSIFAVRHEGHAWRTDPAGAAVFVGWSPPADVRGRYTVTAWIGTSEDQTTAAFHHRDRDLVRRAVEAALHALLPGTDVGWVVARWRELAPESEWR